MRCCLDGAVPCSGPCVCKCCNTQRTLPADCGQPGRTSSFTPRRSYSEAYARREASQMRLHALSDSSSPDCSFVTASRDRALKPSSPANRSFAALHGRPVPLMDSSEKCGHPYVQPSSRCYVTAARLRLAGQRMRLTHVACKEKTVDAHHRNSINVAVLAQQHRRRPPAQHMRWLTSAGRCPAPAMIYIRAEDPSKWNRHKAAG